MSNNNLRNQIQLVNQAINASINSLNLTKQLIRDLEKLSGATATSMPGVGRTVSVPGIIGVYDGENMVTEKGDKFPVPQNYASKSGLVYGDTLKRIEEGGGLVFKQVQRVKRLKTPGVLVKKEGRWVAVTSDGSYKVLDRTVEHFGLKEGAEILAVVPESNKTVPFAALEMPVKVSVNLAGTSSPGISSKPAEAKEEEKEPKKEVKKEEKVEKEEKPASKKETVKPAPKAKRAEKFEKTEKSDKSEQKSEKNTEKEEAPKAESMSLNDDDLR